MSDYRAFVKANISKMPSDTPSGRMSLVAKAWRELHEEREEQPCGTAVHKESTFLQVPVRRSHKK